MATVDKKSSAGLVDYREGSSESDAENDSGEEYLVPRKRARRDRNGMFLNNAHPGLKFFLPYIEHKLSRSCPYLDTIDRSVLDFDFEKLCSISLLNNNVYACLVCGKYFQGMKLHCYCAWLLALSLQVEGSIHMRTPTVSRWAIVCG